MTALNVITLEEAKEWLRVDFNDEDTKITELIHAAVQWVEGYTGLYLFNREVTHEVTASESCAGTVTIFGKPNLTLISIDGVTTDLPTVRDGSFCIDSTAKVIVYSIGYLNKSDIPQPLITAAKKFLALQYEESIDGQKEVPSEIRRLIDQYRLFTWF